MRNIRKMALMVGLAMFGFSSIFQVPIVSEMIEAVGVLVKGILSIVIGG